MDREAVRSKIKELFEPLEYVNAVYATCLTGDEDVVEVYTVMKTDEWRLKREDVYTQEMKLMEIFPDYNFDFHTTTADFLMPDARVVFRKDR